MSYVNPDLGKKFAQLAEEISVWSQKTFGDDTMRGPIGPLKHLEKEVTETIQEWLFLQTVLRREEKGRTPTTGEVAVRREYVLREFADCLILILDASRRANIQPVEMLNAALAKMEVNRSRTYPRPAGDEVSEHVRGSSE